MEEASVSIRLNPFKGLAGPEGTPVPWSPYGRILADRPVFTLGIGRNSALSGIGSPLSSYSTRGPLL